MSPAPTCPAAHPPLPDIRPLLPRLEKMAYVVESHWSLPANASAVSAI